MRWAPNTLALSSQKTMPICVLNTGPVKHNPMTSTCTVSTIVARSLRCVSRQIPRFCMCDTSRIAIAPA